MYLKFDEFDEDKSHKVVIPMHLIVEGVPNNILVTPAGTKECTLTITCPKITKTVGVRITVPGHKGVEHLLVPVAGEGDLDASQCAQMLRVYDEDLHNMLLPLWKDWCGRWAKQLLSSAKTMLYFTADKLCAKVMAVAKFYLGPDKVPEQFTDKLKTDMQRICDEAVEAQDQRCKDAKEDVQKSLRNLDKNRPKLLSQMERATRTVWGFFDSVRFAAMNLHYSVVYQNVCQHADERARLRDTLVRVLQMQPEQQVRETCQAILMHLDRDCDLQKPTYFKQQADLDHDLHQVDLNCVERFQADWQHLLQESSKLQQDVMDLHRDHGHVEKINGRCCENQHVHEGVAPSIRLWCESVHKALGGTSVGELFDRALFAYRTPGYSHGYLNRMMKYTQHLHECTRKIYNMLNEWGRVFDGTEEQVMVALRELLQECIKMEGMARKATEGASDFLGEVAIKQPNDGKSDLAVFNSDFAQMYLDYREKHIHMVNTCTPVKVTDKQYLEFVRTYEGWLHFDRKQHECK